MNFFACHRLVVPTTLAVLVLAVASTSLFAPPVLQGDDMVRVLEQQMHEIADFDITWKRDFQYTPVPKLIEKAAKERAELQKEEPPDDPKAAEAYYGKILQKHIEEIQFGKPYHSAATWLLHLRGLEDYRCEVNYLTGGDPAPFGGEMFRVAVFSSESQKLNPDNSAVSHDRILFLNSFQAFPTATLLCRAHLLKKTFPTTAFHWKLHLRPPPSDLILDFVKEEGAPMLRAWIAPATTRCRRVVSLDPDGAESDPCEVPADSKWMPKFPFIPQDCLNLKGTAEEPLLKILWHCESIAPHKEP